MTETGPDRARLLPLLREIGALKRVTSADRPGSIASRLFRRSWSALVAGAGAENAALAITARALAATRLGDLDSEMLAALGLSPAEAEAILAAALAEVSGDLPGRLRSDLAAAVTTDLSGDGTTLPAFADRLDRQPRAGATCPGRPRTVLGPAESHAEHCLIVAVYAVLLAEPGTDRGRVFLASLAHHLHNAAMPDSGFAGEVLLGPHLAPVMERATELALAQLVPPLRAAVVDARAILPDAGTPEGRAFHAADVIDRVLEIDQHFDVARITLADVLGPMALVHEGPVKAFHDRVLAEMGLL